MKTVLKKIILWLLKIMAKHRLKKFRGKIIAITGSVGKTSTKDAVFSVLNTRFKVKRNKKSMNSDFGMLLTILDIESGFSSAVKWIWLLTKAFVHCMRKDLSEVLLLEMGVDKAGDMDFLTSIIKPDIAIMTNIYPVHMDEGQFGSLEEIFKEKSKLVMALKEGGSAILNTDDEFMSKLSRSCPKKRVISFGKNEDALYRISEISSSLEGLSFRIDHKDYQALVHLNVLGDYNAYTAVPAIICGIIMGMGIEDILTALTRFTLPPGRMSIIPAKHDCTILDSSYNSSPQALKEALKILKDVARDHRKICVLGNMNELGEKSKELHETIGDIVQEHTDILLTVGSEAKVIADKAKEKGMDPSKIFSFKNAMEAINFFEKEIKKGDVILVKGSQNKVRLEKFVKAFMENPEDAENVLARQEKAWELKL